MSNKDACLEISSNLKFKQQKANSESSSFEIHEPIHTYGTECRSLSILLKGECCQWLPVPKSYMKIPLEELYFLLN